MFKSVYHKILVIFIDNLIKEYSFNVNDYIFKYDGKEIDKNKSLIENDIEKNIIIIMKKKSI